ncbi:Diaminopimelate epimerase-like protein [Marasmius fiardii PR-910]|nr:Diaminopimelate epimerase-like protein [Marasmius fiardii PR-910]
MPLKLNYYQYDIFTTTRFLGNPLAIVHVPPSVFLTQEQKQSIAREFNLSETTFVHDEESGTQAQTIFRTDIFTPHTELPFAGHPTVGTGFHLLSARPDNDVTLRIKAGDTLVTRTGDGSVRLQVPVDFKIHPSLKMEKLIIDQKNLRADDFKERDQIPIASIVKGMTFVLLEINDLDGLSRMYPYVEDIVIPSSHLGVWPGSQSETTKALVYAYTVVEEGGQTRIRTRMFAWAGYEDPATGSAACTLGAYLALKKGTGKWRFEITQGVEIGRKSDIMVVAEIGDGNVVEDVRLEGSAIRVMEGSLTLDA